MIDVKAAVSSASSYLRSLQDVIGDSLENLMLEEVELSDDKRFWLITLGFDRPSRSSFFPIGGSPTIQRTYKLFRVNAETGEVEAMKIREV